MKNKVCCIRDEKLAVFGQPFTAPALGVALRSFDDACNSTPRDNDIAKHPEDFSLWLLGTYDDETGKFTENEPTHLAKGVKHV